MPEKSKYHHGNLRAALIEASLDLIQERGVQALTLREIGAAVGVSRMAAYRHFAGKEDLLAAISHAGFTQFGEALDQARRQAPDDFDSKLDAMGVAYVRFAVEHRSYYAVMFGSVDGSVPEAAKEAADAAFGILEETIREGQQQGKIQPGNSVQIARAVWALVHGASTLPLEPDLGKGGAGSGFVLFCCGLMRHGLRGKPTLRPEEAELTPSSGPSTLRP